MHPKDLALVWEWWSHGESLFDIAMMFEIPLSQMHQELQDFLDAKTRVRAWVGAA